MDFAQQQRNPRKHLIGIAFVLIFHITLVWALVTGLAQKAVEVVKAPFETKLIQEASAPEQPETPPPPPPKLAVPPPPFIPPPELVIAVEAPPQVVVPPVQTQASKAVIDSKFPCEKPEYPAASLRNKEQGTVTLRFLIDEKGRVLESQIERSSGFPRLDRATRQALSECMFKPFIIDGKPKQAWGSLHFQWNALDEASK